MKLRTLLDNFETLQLAAKRVVATQEGDLLPRSILGLAAALENADRHERKKARKAERKRYLRALESFFRCMNYAELRNQQALLTTLMEPLGPNERFHMTGLLRLIEAIQNIAVVEIKLTEKHVRGVPK